MRFPKKFMFLSALNMKCQVVEIADKIPNALALLLISEIVAFAFVDILSNNAFAQTQTLYNKTLYEVVKQTSGLNENPHVDVGISPRAIDFDSNTVYVGNTDSNSVSVIDATTNEKIEEDIPVGDYPFAIAINGFTETVYVGNSGSDTVSVISTQNNTKIKDIPVGDGPEAIDIHEFTGMVYVANSGSDNVSVIDARTNEKIKDIPVGLDPRDIGVHEFARKVYVTNSASGAAPGNVSVIDATTNEKIEEDIPVGNYPFAIAINPFVETVYVANIDSNSVSVIDARTNEKIKDIPVGDEPYDITDPNLLLKKVYVANYNANSVSVIDATTNEKIEEDIPVGEGPQAIDINPSTGIVYVANIDSNSVSVINATTNEKIKDIPVGETPQTISVNPFTNAVYTLNRFSNSISVIDGTANKLVAGVTFQVVPFNSGYIACEDSSSPSPVGQYVYVYSDDECTAIPNEGFEFASWAENLTGSATQLINVSRPASIWDSFASSVSTFPNDSRSLIMKSFQGNEIVEPEATLKVTKFGNFTATFREIPAPIPQEYQLLFVSVFLTSIATLVTAWFSSRGKEKRREYDIP